jgi:hypothetical protein
MDMGPFDYNSAARQVTEYEKSRKNIATLDGNTLALAMKEGPDTAGYYQKLDICRAFD